MPALTAPQLALIRSQPQTSEWYIHPIVPPTIFAARINDAAITVGARTITYDTVTIGAYTDIKAGMTLWVGTAPNTYNVARIRVRSATSAHLIVAENSDVAWADNYYLTVKREWLCWSIRPFINPSGTVFKDYDIAYTDQTLKWPPVAMMGDPVCKPWAGNPTSVYFDGSESYATSPGATITGYAWDFGDGTTSTAATPGNHNYTSAGDRWASLTVTDSNGKTCVTYRPVSLPDPATLYTAKFEEQSLESAIDAGWTGQCNVFAPLATIAEFPERAPVFLIAVNTYGGTAGSVGYPRGRENVVLFGYIQENSVEETPETSSIQFTMESVDKVAARAAAITTFVADATTPANWDEGKSLNIFRSFVYLLAFQSTLFQIADVRLFNDTTLIKIARFPEDNLWNMFAQFARGARLMRCGVTRTGRVIVSRDPNLLPIASRGVVTTVCQLQDGDWADTVTIPEHPFPATSFLCLSGVSYDGNPAHDPAPLFGMSPGHPPKEYGVSREIHDLALVNQTEANTIAGLAVGQDNNAFGDVNIPLWANWIGAFDPAYQEYVKAPAGGFVTNRGTLLAADSLIVRKVSIGFDWEAGAMRSTLSCEVYSYPDIGVTGDCYTTDAPQPPPTHTPPIIPQPHPNPTGSGTIPVHVWTLYSGSAIYHLTSLTPAGGIASSLSNWASAFSSLYYATGHVVAAANKQAIIAETSGIGTNLYTAYSGNEAVGWTVTDPVLEGFSSNVDADRTNRARVWGVSLQPRNPFFDSAAKALLAAQPAGVGQISYAGALANWTSWYADWGPIYVFHSSNSGQTFTPYLLAYIGQLLPTRMVLTGPPSPTGYGYVGGDSNETVAPTLTDWETHFCTAVLADKPPGGIYGGTYYISGTQIPDLGWIQEYHDGGGAFMQIIYKVCFDGPMQDVNNLTFFPPTPMVVLVAPAHDDSTAFVMVAASYYTNVYTTQVDPSMDASIQAPASPLQYAPNNANTLDGAFFENFLFRINSSGVASSVTINNSGATLDFLASDPTNTDRVYLADTVGQFIREIWGTGDSAQTLPVGASATVFGIFVTHTGAILVGYTTGGGACHILRSTNNGGTWTDIDVSGSVSFWDVSFLPAEYNNTVVVVNVETTGKYLYSINDGAAWSLSGDITVHDDVNASSAR